MPEEENKKLFENAQWMVFENDVEAKRERKIGSAYWFPKTSFNEHTYKHIAEKTWVDDALWKEAYDQAVELWGLSA